MPREAPARAVARSKVASATTDITRIPPHAYQSAQLLLGWRTVQLIYRGDKPACIRPIRGQKIGGDMRAVGVREQQARKFSREHP